MSTTQLSENHNSNEVKVCKMTHVWTIDDFDSREAAGGDIVSPEFSSCMNDEAKWLIKLVPNAIIYGNAIGLYLYLSKNTKCKTVFAKISFLMLNYEQKKEAMMRSTSNSHKFVATDTNHSTGWGWGKFCQKDDDFRKELLSNNKLRISCEIIFSTESDNALEHHRFRNMPYLMSTHADRDVTENLGLLFKTHLLSDVVISAGGKDHPAHKAILAARSKVFAAMFQHDTKENQLNRVEIEDMSEEMVSEMLRFIYTGRCENLDELAGGLLVAADKYNLDLLKTICNEFLCESLSIENAAQHLILADMHSADDLKSDVMNFIVTEPTKVFNTAGWKSMLSYPILIDEVCRAVARRLELVVGDRD